MRHERLPATLNKKDSDKESPTFGQNLPNIVKVTNTVRMKEEAKAKGLEKVPELSIEIPANEFEYPQFDSIKEAIDDAGGEDKFLAIFNDLTAKDATATGKAVIRTATSGTEQEIVAAGLKACKLFSWKEESSLSLKERAQGFDEVAQLAAKVKSGEITMTLDDLMARVLALQTK